MHGSLPPRVWNNQLLWAQVQHPSVFASSWASTVASFVESRQRIKERCRCMMTDTMLFELSWRQNNLEKKSTSSLVCFASANELSYFHGRNHAEKKLWIFSASYFIEVSYFFQNSEVRWFRKKTGLELREYKTLQNRKTQEDFLHGIG